MSASEYSSDGNLNSKSFLEYSLKNRFVTRKIFSYYKDTTLCILSSSWKLNKNHFAVESKNYDGISSNFSSHYINKYDKKGNLIQCDIETVINDSIKKTKENYQYNSSGKLLTLEEIKDGRKALRKSNSYMKNGLLELKYEYTGNGKLYCKSKYEYKLRK